MHHLVHHLVHHASRISSHSHLARKVIETTLAGCLLRTIHSNEKWTIEISVFPFLNLHSVRGFSSHPCLMKPEGKPPFPYGVPMIFPFSYGFSFVFAPVFTLRSPCVFKDVVRKKNCRVHGFIWVKHSLLSPSDGGGSDLCRGRIQQANGPMVYPNLIRQYSHVFSSWWYTYPSKKYESQLGWWKSQYMEK